METNGYTLDRLVTELREARAQSSSEREVLRRVQAIALGAAGQQGAWLRDEMCRPDPKQGFGFHLLHEEAGHELAVFVASWLPGGGTPPHDHGTWAVVVGLKGCERNIRWRRLDDGAQPGYAEIVPAGECLVGAGDVVTMHSGAIHSVCNQGVGISASLHIYGRHVNHTNRSQFDPAARREAPYEVATSTLLPAISPTAEADHDR